MHARCHGDQCSAPTGQDRQPSAPCQRGPLGGRTSHYSPTNPSAPPAADARQCSSLGGKSSRYSSSFLGESHITAGKRVPMPKYRRVTCSLHRALSGAAGPLPAHEKRGPVSRAPERAFVVMRYSMVILVTLAFSSCLGTHTVSMPSVSLAVRPAVAASLRYTPRVALHSQVSLCR